jgi:hypothetical protein
MVIIVANIIFYIFGNIFGLPSLIKFNIMKKYIISLTIFTLFLFQTKAQNNANDKWGTATTGTSTNGNSGGATTGTTASDLLHQAGAAIGGATGGSGALNDLQLQTGMRDALTQCLTNGANAVAIKDGFFKNKAIKIFFPKEASIVESTLRSAGLGSVCDQAIIKFNRAAEDATSKANPIFMNAIKQMSIQDVSGILLGADNSCTEYFKKATTAQLIAQFLPLVNVSLNDVGAIQAWELVMKSYNKIPMVKPVNTNLSQYVTGKAIDGLFFMIAKEELKVRQNIASRTTPMMKDVFAWVDQHKKTGK